MRPCGCQVSEEKDAECRAIGAAATEDVEIATMRVTTQRLLHLQRQ
jgi:hypothetical protein